MFKNKEHKPTSIETGSTSYFDQIIIALLLVIIFAVPLFFDVRLYSVFDLSKVTILYILAFTALAIWSVKTIISSHSPYHLAQPLNLPIIAFVFVSGLATFFSINPYVSLAGTYKRYDGFISILVYVFLFYAVINFIQRRRLDLLINVIILTACIASIYGVFQHFGLDLYKWNTNFGFGTRVCSTFGHPAFFSAFLIMVIPLVLIKIFSCPPERRGRAGRERFKVYLCIGILALLLITFYYTKTRASFLGLIISNLFFFSLIGRKTLLANKAKTIVTLTVLVGIFLFYNINDKTSVTERFIQDIKPTFLENEAGFAPQLKGTSRERVFQYITGLNIIRDYPVLGIGPDTLGIIYPQYIAKIYKEREEHGNFKNQNRIHNDFLDVTISRGLLGLGVYIWFIVAYSRMVWKGCKKAVGLDKILIIGICSSCLGYFIQNQFSFGHIPIITLFWFLIGMSVIACSARAKLSLGRYPLTGLSSHQTNPPEHPPERRYRAGNPADPSERQGRAGSQILTKLSLAYAKWFNNPTLERLVKTTACGLIICLMVLLITLSLFFYKADIYFSNGRKFLNKDSMIEAVESLKMAVKYNPLEINYRNVLNDMYLKMAATSKAPTDKAPTERGKAELSSGGDKSVEEDMSNSSTQEQTTMWLANTIVGAKEVQRLYPKDYRSAFTLGQAYHLLDGISNKDMSKDAIKYYKRATTLHPFMFKLRDKLAQIYVEKGHYQKAIHELKEAIRIKPANPVPYINLTNIFIKLGRYEEARKSCNRILELGGSANSKHNEYAKNKLEFLSNLQDIGGTNTSGAREKGKRK